MMPVNGVGFFSKSTFKHYNHILLNRRFDEIMKDQEKTVKIDNKETSKEDIFATEEIELEEMAIDGICGVY